MIYKWPGFLAISKSSTDPVTHRNVERDNLLTGEGGGRYSGIRGQII
jgi:hypothetical protein